jgi:hypothetical protein
MIKNGRIEDVELQNRKHQKSVMWKDAEGNI